MGVYYKVVDGALRPKMKSGGFTDRVATAAESFVDEEFTPRDIEKALRIYDHDTGKWVRLDANKRKQMFDHLSRWSVKGYLSRRRQYVDEGATVEAADEANAAAG